MPAASVRSCGGRNLAALPPSCQRPPSFLRRQEPRSPPSVMPAASVVPAEAGTSQPFPSCQWPPSFLRRQEPRSPPSVMPVASVVPAEAGTSQPSLRHASGLRRSCGGRNLAALPVMPVEAGIQAADRPRGGLGWDCHAERSRGISHRVSVDAALGAGMSLVGALRLAATPSFPHRRESMCPVGRTCAAAHTAGLGWDCHAERSRSISRVVRCPLLRERVRVRALWEVMERSVPVGSLLTPAPYPVAPASATLVV